MVKEAGRHCVSDLDCIARLRKAIAKVEPRVQRMRARLDAIRARKAGKPRCPKWAMP